MRKAYDTILSDYVDADTVAKGGDFEPYRYECACCWEEVRLCAADSKNQATHFRHRSGNNYVECENYLGNRSAIISNALSRNARDKIEFYFSNATKLFSIGVKFSGEEIAAYERSGESFQVRNAFAAKPAISIPITSSRFLPDISEHIPMSEFSWEYYVSSTNDSKRRKYEMFRKDGRGYLYPTFFKIQNEGDSDNFQAKLVRTDTLYTNTPYLIMFSYSYHTLSFQNDVKVGEVIKFKTMGRDFAGVVVTFTKKTARIEQQLHAWKYKLESNETLSLLWPPSSQVDGIISIGTEYAFIFSSFALQAHGNTNVHSGGIVNLGDGISKIAINNRTKIYKKNTELVLDKHEDAMTEFDVLTVSQTTAKNYVAPDDGAYLFNRSGVFQMSKGMSTPLSTESAVRHYSCSYLDDIVTAPDNANKVNGANLIHDILMYYKRTEVFNWSDYESLDLSSDALKYIDTCEKTGLINSAAKRHIEEGRI